jgi:hypothetical protein
MVRTFRSRRSYPPLSDGISSRRLERRANLPNSEAPHATIEARTITAVAIVNQNSRLARGPKRSILSLRQGRGCRRCSTTNCWRRQRFSAISSAFGLKVAAMAKTSSRNTCPPPPSSQQGRLAGDLSIPSPRINSGPVLAPYRRQSFEFPAGTASASLLGLQRQNANSGTRRIVGHYCAVSKVATVFAQLRGPQPLRSLLL